MTHTIEQAVTHEQAIEWLDTMIACTPKHGLGYEGSQRIMKYFRALTEPVAVSKTDEELANAFERLETITIQRTSAERKARDEGEGDLGYAYDTVIEQARLALPVITQAFTAIRAQARSEALAALELAYSLIDPMAQSEEDICEIETAIRKLKATK